MSYGLASLHFVFCCRPSGSVGWSKDAVIVATADCVFFPVALLCTGSAVAQDPAGN